MKIYVLTFTDVQTNEKQVEVYPTLKLAQIHRKGKIDDAIAKSNIPDLIGDESDYMCYVKDVCEATIEISYVSFHDFIAHKIVEYYCNERIEARLYYDIIYDVVCGFKTSEYPDIDNKSEVYLFISTKLHDAMALSACRRLTRGVGLSFENFNKVVGYLQKKVGNYDLARIINGEMIAHYQIQYDNDNPNEPLFNHKKVWAFSSTLWGGANFSPDFEFRLFEKYDDAADALIEKKKKVYDDFRSCYDEDDIFELSKDEPNPTEYRIYNSDDVWDGKVEARYIE